MDKQRIVIVVMVACLGLSTVVGFTGCDRLGGPGVIVPVFDWVIGFATDVGEWVIAKATTFAEAVAAAWKAFWGTDLVGNVKPDKDDPLKGTYDGILRCEARWGKAGDDEKPGNRLEIELDHPRMVRESADTAQWDLAPRERDRIDKLQEQLLSEG